MAAGVVLSVALATGCASPKPMTSPEKVRSSLEDLRVTLQSTLQDPAKLAKALLLADQLDAHLEEGVERLVDLQQEQGRLYGDYHATREQFRQNEQELQMLRSEVRARVLAIRQQLAELATDAEWKQIVARDMSLLEI